MSNLNIGGGANNNRKSFQDIIKMKKTPQLSLENIQK